MLLPHVLVLTLALTPSLVSAALFPSDTRVKSIDEKGFKRAMKQNQTSLVAFVAPWCGYCQRMAPEYSKAAVGLDPLIPLYAVDCDVEKNKMLCAEQGVKSFPTVKLFPRGGQMSAVDYNSNDRTAKAFFYWASNKVPHTVKKLGELEDVADWVVKKVDKPRALLFNKDKKIPLLWKVLSNKYVNDVEFAIHRDRGTKNDAASGVGADDTGKSKVLVYPSNSHKGVVYEGSLKMNSLSKFFDSVLDGTADLGIADDGDNKSELNDMGVQPETPESSAEQVVLEARTDNVEPGTPIEEEVSEPVASEAAVAAEPVPVESMVHVELKEEDSVEDHAPPPESAETDKLGERQLKDEL